jgi:CubicO group peptidase (beta-lactamase class C family)
LQATAEVLRSAVAEGRIPGIVAAVGGADGATYLDAVGMAATAPQRAMQPDQVFRIASMTKLVTSVAIMLLVEEGRVDLDAPLEEYVTGFAQPPVLTNFDSATGTYATRPARRDATIRELLSHTAGYGYWFLHEPLRVASGPEPDLFHPPFLLTDPGTAFAYSTSSDVVGLLVEPVSGLSLDRFFRERLFEPLDMRDTSYVLPVPAERLVHVHRRSGRGFRQLPQETRNHQVRGGGGLNSTARDYLRLLRCLLRGGELDGRRILDRTHVAELSRNQIGTLEARMQRTALGDRSNDFIFMDGSQKFGFGVMIETRQRPGMRAPGAFGWGGIFNTWFWVDPAHDLAAVLLMQMAPFANKASIALLQSFEQAVYADVDGGSGK